MKAIKSSLHSVRKLREGQEQQALREYGKRLQELEQARNKLEAAELQVVASWEAFHQCVARGAGSAELARLQAYCQCAETHNGDCEEAMYAARDLARLAFIKMLAARRARAEVDKVPEAQKRPYRHERRRDEPKALGDLATSRLAVLAVQPPPGEPVWN